MYLLQNHNNSLRCHQIYFDFKHTLKLLLLFILLVTVSHFPILGFRIISKVIIDNNTYQLYQPDSK